MSRTIRASLALFATAALVFAGCSDDDTDSISSEAQQRVDQASDDADDLKDQVEKKLDEAGEQFDEGVARGQAEIFRQRLTDLGRDEPSIAVTDLEDIASDLPGDPEVTGIEDDDGDGDDDDGKVEISVDESSACVTISGSSVEVDDGAC